LDVKDIKCLVQWWQKHEAMFLIVGFLTQIFLSVVGFQTEMKECFLWLEYLTTLGDVHKLKF
jgi:hypothetical protein